MLHLKAERNGGLLLTVICEQVVHASFPRGHLDAESRKGLAEEPQDIGGTRGIEFIAVIEERIPESVMVVCGQQEEKYCGEYARDVMTLQRSDLKLFSLVKNLQVWPY